jgi:hypothetical protein
VIPSPLEEALGGTWFLARSADGERLMLINEENSSSYFCPSSNEFHDISHRRNGLNLRGYRASIIHVF